MVRFAQWRPRRHLPAVESASASVVRRIGAGWLASRTSAGARVRVTRNIAPELVSLPDGFIARFNRADDEARFYLRPRVTTLTTPKMLCQSMHHYD